MNKVTLALCAVLAGAILVAILFFNRRDSEIASHSQNKSVKQTSNQDSAMVVSPSASTVSQSSVVVSMTSAVSPLLAEGEDRGILPGQKVVVAPAGDEVAAKTNRNWRESLLEGSEASDEKMVFLCLEWNGQEIVLQSQSMVEGNMRLPGAFVPADGVYHRIVSDKGDVLAHGVTPDPRILHWDVPAEDGSGRLEGGVLKQEQVTFPVRYPLIQGMASIEFYHVSRTTDVSCLDRKGGSFCGSFALEIPAR